ncbi:MAG: thioredoxin family protein [Bacillota bacterium]|nr:thioredoxin family protein [Bacillota bacterium]
MGKQLAHRGETESPSSPSRAALAAARQRGLPVWLLFHSSNCEPCKEMEAVFDRLRPEFEGRVAFVSVNVEDRTEEDLVRQYGVQFIPTTFLLDKSGQVVARAVGVIPVEEMRAALTRLAGGS